MRLESVREAVATEFRKIDKTDRKPSGERPKEVKKDSASFSAGSAKATSETKNLAARIAIEPEVRMDRVAQVKERVSSGFYNSSEFADQLADKLTNEFM